MRRIALTGGIATGKSYVLARLRAAGVPTVDADRLVHEALSAASPLVPLVVSRFGRGVLASDGSIDRSALGAIVFADANGRRDLEAILHPHVYRLIDEWFASLSHDCQDVRESGRPEGVGPTRPTRPAFAVADIPLLYETGYENLFDRVIVAACPRELQLQRSAQRGMSREQALARIEAQWPIEEKTRRADYVVETSGTFEQTDRQVDRVIQELTAHRSS